MIESAPASGRAGTSQSRPVIRPTPPGGAHHPQRLEQSAEAENQRQADRDFGCRHDQDEDNEHLPVSLPPLRAGGDENQRGSI